jgi:hypothetical protein
LIFVLCKEANLASCFAEDHRHFLTQGRARHS